MSDVADRPGAGPHVHAHHFIDGRWEASLGAADDDVLEVFDSTDGSLLGHVPAGGARDVDAAVAAAARAFETWSATPASERSRRLGDIAGALSGRTEELAALITRETGMPIGMSRMAQAAFPLVSIGAAAALATSFNYEEVRGTTRIVREPIGVVGCITPWNYPLHQICAKVAYAIAAGCTVVLKPSEVAPLDAIALAEAAKAVDLPAGVLNVVFGLGPVVGEALAAHPDVQMISFTGSTATGRRIGAVASGSVKRVALELGGKSANVLLDDLDDEQLERAARDGVMKCFLNSGQTCAALTRMLVPRALQARVEAIVADEIAQRYQPGDPFSDGTFLGPLASAAQVERVVGHVRRAISDGARLVVGGPDRPDGVGDGFYVTPTVFADVTNDLAIAREEIFGPVLSILPYDSEDEAVSIANDSPYGLSGGVWSSDPARAERFARRLRTGQVVVNAGQFDPSAPFGGYKQSGLGREFGVHGFSEFLETKTLLMEAAPA